MIPEHGKLIGDGQGGFVYEYGEDKVIKVFKYNGEYDSKFYPLCISGISKHLPIVYEYNKEYVIMEKLEINTMLCQKYIAVFRDYWMKKVFSRVYSKEHWEQKYQDIYDDWKANWKGFNKKVFDWCVELYDVLITVRTHPFSDLRLSNIGQRPKTNDVIFFDV